MAVQAGSVKQLVGLVHEERVVDWRRQLDVSVVTGTGEVRQMTSLATGLVSFIH